MDGNCRHRVGGIHRELDLGRDSLGRECVAALEKDFQLRLGSQLGIEMTIMRGHHEQTLGIQAIGAGIFVELGRTLRPGLGNAGQNQKRDPEPPHRPHSIARCES